MSINHKRSPLKPRWLTQVPQGSHGASIYQRKLWKVTSDYVRIRDFYIYGACISCQRRMNSWKEGQAGHYKAYSVCRGYSKWDLDNIFMQCSTCNTAYDGNVVGRMFAEGIVERCGKERLETLERFGSKPLEKLDNLVIIGLTHELIKSMADLPEQPEYYKYVIEARDF